MNRMTIASAVIALVASAGVTTAGDCPTNCPSPPPSLFGGHGQKCNKIYPLSDSKYIKQFCGPTVSPNACFGHFKTQWRRWEEACGEPLPPETFPKQYAGSSVEEPEQETPSTTNKKDGGKANEPKKDSKIEEPKKASPMEPKSTDTPAIPKAPMPMEPKKSSPAAPPIEPKTIEVPKLEEPKKIPMPMQTPKVELPPLSVPPMKDVLPAPKPAEKLPIAPPAIEIPPPPKK